METNLASFEQDVIETSRHIPVLVDFWAPWCGPCRTLGPMLEQLEAEAGGRWRLVKVNADENPELSAHFQVRSIPFVLAFVNGQPVDQFVGVLPESQLREFLAKLQPNPVEQARQAALEALRADDKPLAIEHLRNALALDPGHDQSRLELIELLLEDSQTGSGLEAARAELALLTPRTTHANDARYLALITRLDALEAAAALPDAATLEARLASDPADLDARFDLASRAIAEQDFETALAQLLEIVQRDRNFRDQIGRKTMLSVFELMSYDPARVAHWRRALSSALN